jgi:hypothetical protein
MTAATDTGDAALLETLAHGAFNYFIENVNPVNGLVADTNRTASPCSIAVTGFALTAYTIGVERGWIGPSRAIELTLAALRFFWNSPSDETASTTGYKGFYYHFLDMQTGLRVWDCELSIVDTAFLITGMLASAAYFTADSAEEIEIRDLVDKIYRRVDWQWAQNGGTTLTQGWKPGSGFLHYGWEGYNEGTIIYLLGLASPTFPIDTRDYEAWTVTYQWENIYGHDVLYAGPLFIHQFSHAWVDFRGIRDRFMIEKKSDYFENTRRSTYIQRTYCQSNPRRFQGYGENCWGLSAGEGPNDLLFHINGYRRPSFGYSARGTPHGPDDGTVAPASITASLPFAPEIALPALNHILETYPTVRSNDRLSTGVNPTARAADGSVWISDGHFGLDQGITLLMIENYRSEFVWKLTKRCPAFLTGLKQAGFTGGWLK